MPYNIYKVNIIDGKEELLRTAVINPIVINSLKKIVGISSIRCYLILLSIPVSVLKKVEAIVFLQARNQYQWNASFFYFPRWINS